MNELSRTPRFRDVNFGLGDLDPPGNGAQVTPPIPDSVACDALPRHIGEAAWGGGVTA